MLQKRDIFIKKRKVIVILEIIMYNESIENRDRKEKKNEENKQSNNHYNNGNTVFL